MNSLIRTLCAGALAVALFCSPAEAGRVGGPAKETAVIPYGKSWVFNVELQVGMPAIIRVVCPNAGAVDLYVYDGDGNLVQGYGLRNDRVAKVYVYRTGVFRVEVRNVGPTATTAIAATN